MKKLMLIMAGALVSLSACSKSADEPVAKQNQAGEELVNINVSFEGEREPIQVVDQEGRALNLKTTVQDNLIKGIALDGGGEVDGVIYLYRLGDYGTDVNTNGIARRVKFKVNGNKISYKGTIATDVRRGELLFRKMDVYVGGQIKNQTIEPRGKKDPRGGDISYYPPTATCIRTEEGMDLSKFNPIFYSQGIDVTPAKDGQTQDYYSTGHKLKLFGEFISCRVRLARTVPNVQAKYNGFLLRGFGSEGATIEAPSKANGGKPTFGKVMASATRRPNQARFFSVGQTYYVWGDGKAPSIYSNANTNAQAPRSDDAYTFYLFTPIEPQGGIRPAFNRSTDVLTPKHGWVPPYWGKSDSQPYTSKQANFGKFHNLIVSF